MPHGVAHCRWAAGASLRAARRVSPSTSMSAIVEGLVKAAHEKRTKDSLP